MADLEKTLAQFVSGGHDILWVDNGDGTFSPKVAATFSGTLDTEIPAAAALADDTANPTTPSLGSYPHVYDGTTWDRLRGTSADGVLVNLGSNNDVTIGAALPAGTALLGGVNVRPEASGGLSIFRSLDLDETEEEVKATAGQVYGAWVTNTATTTRFLKFYNADAATVQVGTTVPVITIAIPGNASDDVSGHFAAGGCGIAFSTAITVAATTGAADADTGAPGANEVIVNILYA